MKERTFRWIILVLAFNFACGEKSNSKDDEDDSYDIRTNEVDKHDDAANRVFQLINDAAMKIVDAPDLSRVKSFNFDQLIHYLSMLNFRKNPLINLKNNYRLMI